MRIFCYQMADSTVQFIRRDGEEDEILGRGGIEGMGGIGGIGGFRGIGSRGGIGGIEGYRGIGGVPGNHSTSVLQIIWRSFDYGRLACSPVTGRHSFQERSREISYKV